MLVDYRKVNIYQDEELILKDVDWNIDEGQFVYVIGKVGSGKSSLLKTLYCELDIYSDEAEKAEVLERDVIHIKRKEIPALRREMGIIFQDFQLLHDRTVYSNLRFVLKSTGWKNNDDIDNRITEVLENGHGRQKRQTPTRAFGWRAATHCHSTRLAEHAKNNYCRRAHWKPRPRNSRQHC